MFTDDFGLAELLHPILIPTFLHEHWDKRPLVLPRRAPDHYRGLLDRDDLETMLEFARPMPPHDLSVVNRRKAVNVAAILEKWSPAPDLRPRLAALHGAYADGHTLFVNVLQDRWPSIARLCQNLERDLACRVNANLYVTPAHSQGFPVHYGDHDTVILQISGRKDWKVYRPIVELAMHNAIQQAGEDWGPPVETCTLETGDLLYLPRGVPHEAICADASSMHLTLGLVPVRWKDLVIAAVLEHAEHDVRLRESLPAGWLTDSGAADRAHDRVRSLLSGVLNAPRVAAALDTMAVAFINKMPRVPGGHFGQIDLLSSIDAATRVTIRPGTKLRIVHREGALWFVFPGNEIGVDPSLEPIVRFIERRRSFVVGELPGDFADGEKIDLIRGFVREGLMCIEGIG